jgi:endo-1,4-beta-xylanase
MLDNAVRQGWRVRASHLVYGERTFLPDWLKTGHYTRDEYIQILHDHINTVVGRYKGRVQEWSIANEAPQRSLTPGTDFWRDKIGPDYIKMAFTWAREADPGGLLIFNSGFNWAPQDALTSRTINRMLAMVKDLKGQGVPIDVVGVEMHLFLAQPMYMLFEPQVPPAKESVIQTMRQFAQLGVRIFITEMDTDLTRQAGSQGQRWTFQAQVYKSMVEACLESGVCDNFSTWGISDVSPSWLNCTGPFCMNEPNADALMFDKEFRPKPAYFAVRDALAATPGAGTSTPKP